MSESHFSSLRFHHCYARGLLADRAAIDNGLVLDGLEPLQRRGSCAAHQDFCQLRMISTRVQGGILFRQSLFRSPTVDQWRKDPRSQGAQLSSDRLDSPLERGAHANHFAVAIETCDIGGRIWIARDVEIHGGLSLQETIIHGALRIGAKLLAAHVADESIGDAEANHLAFQGTDMRVGGSCIWRSPIKTTIADRERRIFGRVSMIRARIDNDLIFEDCRFINPSRPTGELVFPDEIGGGIDLRRANVGGQLAFLGSCEIGRRGRPTATRMHHDKVGPALDATKATIGLGVVLGAKCTFRGPVHFTAAKIGRSFAIESEIGFKLPPQDPLPAHLQDTERLPELAVVDKLNDARPFQTAFKLTDSVIEGFLWINFARRVTGRVSLQRLSVLGSAEINAIPFADLLPPRGTARFAEAPFQGKDASGVDYRLSHPKTNDPPTFNETSLLDMQDMSLTGGINWKRYAVRLDLPPDRAIPYNHFIIDLRGMSCSTWDDADATCWAGLNQPAPYGRLAKLRGFLTPSAWKHDFYQEGYTPWRLRFDGMKFDRLDSSRQSQGIDPKTTTELARSKAWLHRNMSGWRAWARAIAAKRGNGINFFENRVENLYNWRQITELHNAGDPGRRSYFSLEDKTEILWFRLQAIESYDRNRWRRQRSFLGRLDHFRVRWFRQSHWKRRELKPAFQPQAFDLFARAYAARGDLEISLGITKRRMILHWRKRLRVLVRAYRGITLFSLACVTLVLPLIPLPSPLWITLPIAGLVLLVSMPALMLALAGTAILIFEHLFGFGLNGRRAILAGFLFPFFIATAAPLALSISTTPNCTHFVLGAMGDVEYGLDRLVPGGESGAKVALDRLRDVPSCRADYRRAHWIDTICKLAGWIALSLIVLTLSGFLKRDVERG